MDLVKDLRVGGIVQCGMTWGGSGGLDRYFREFIGALEAQGIRCKALATGSPSDNSISENRVSTFAPTDAFLGRRLWAANRCANELLSDEGVGLVASHFSLYTLPLLRDLKGRPLVVHFHGPWALESECEGACQFAVAAKRWVEQRVYNRASYLITLSNAFAELLVRQFRIPRERIRVIPGGVDTSRFAAVPLKAEARLQLGWPLDRPILVTVRRLVNRMGLSKFIDAIARVRRNHPDVLVHLCGHGKLRKSLASQIASQGLDYNVKLIGYVEEDQLPLVYRAADFSVVPSLHYEGFGLAAAESLASGTPVLVTRVGGLPEVVDGLSDALVVAPDAVAEIADRISQFLSSEISLPHDTFCREHAAQRFAWPTVACQAIDVYREALERSPHRVSKVQRRRDQLIPLQAR